MNIFNEIILVKSSSPRKQYDNEEMLLIVDTKRRLYWFDGVHNESNYYNRDNLDVFYINLWKQELFSRFMNGEFRTNELRKQLFLEQANPNKTVASFSKLIVRYFDTKFKPRSM